MSKVTELIGAQITNAQINVQTWGGVVLNVKAYGAKGDGETDDSEAFQKTANAIPADGGQIIVPFGTYRISKDLDLTDKALISFSKGGQLLVDDGVTFTANVAADPTAHIFSGNGAVVLPYSKEVYPTWFGADRTRTTDSTTAFQNAVNSLLPKGGKVSILSGDYKIDGTIDVGITTSQPNDDVGLIFVGEGINRTVLSYYGSSIMFNAFGDSSDRKFVQWRDMRVRTGTADQTTPFVPGTTAFKLQYNNRYLEFDNIDILSFDTGVYGANVWIINFKQVSTARCNNAFYLDEATNSTNIYGGEHKACATSAIYMNNTSVTNIYGVTIETSTTIEGDGHGILVDSAHRLTIIGIYTENLKGHSFYKRGFDPVNNTFSEVNIVGGRLFNSHSYLDGVPDIKIERPDTIDNSSGNLVMTNVYFKKCDLGHTGQVATWAIDNGCTTPKDSLHDVYVGDEPNYLSYAGSSFPVLNGNTISLVQPKTDPLTDTNIRFLSMIREDTKNKIPPISHNLWFGKIDGGVDWLNIDDPLLGDIDLQTNGIAATINCGGHDLEIFSGRMHYIPPNTVCTFSGKFTKGSGNTEIPLVLTFYDGYDVVLGTEELSTTDTDATFTTPTNLAYAMVSISIPASEATGWYKLDSLQLEIGSAKTSFRPYHRESGNIIVTHEGLEFKVLLGGNNTAEWYVDTSGAIGDYTDTVTLISDGGDKLFSILSAIGAVRAFGHFLSTLYRILPTDPTTVRWKNAFLLDESDITLKFRTQYKEVLPVALERTGATRKAYNPHVGMCWFDTSLGKPVWIKTQGTVQVETLVVTGPATAKGNMAVTLGGVTYTVPTQGTETAEQIGDLLRNAWNKFDPDWVPGGDAGSATVTFTATTSGAQTAGSFSPSTSGVTGTMSTTTTGTADTWVDATGTTV